jgi:hypothetical protein
MLRTIDASALADVTGGAQPVSKVIANRLTETWSHKGPVRLDGAPRVSDLPGRGSHLGQGTFYVDSPIRGLTERRAYTAEIWDGSLTTLRTQHVHWQ